MVYDYFDKFVFSCEMYDTDADKILKLALNFFPFDNSVQVINCAQGKQLLKRTHYPTLKKEMLQIGNVISIFSKLLQITECAPLTTRTLFANSESTFAVIKPMPPSQHGKVISFIMNKGFRIVRLRNGKLGKDLIMKMYQNLGGSMLPIIMDYMTSGDVIGMELVAPHAISYWRECLGAMDPHKAAPGTLRHLYGETIYKNVAHGVTTKEMAAGILDEYFGVDDKGYPKIPFRATCKDCTCCIIKPHVLTDRTLGQILEHINSSKIFEITAMAMVSVSLVNAREFYEIYKGVLPEYENMAAHLAEGNAIVMEVKTIDPKLNSVCEFRKLCGPNDPDKCRQLYPNTIRAHYGKNLIHNAVHCTDLSEDGELEVEYFFKLLRQ